jgi:hypothetical protein
MIPRALGSLIWRDRQSTSTFALRIATHNGVAELRMAADLRRLGGLPALRDAQLYEFTTAERRQRALDDVRSVYGWTSAELEPA